MSDCLEREPRLADIRGSRWTIQSCGFLLCLSNDWRVRCASDNLSGFLGLGPTEVLGRSISDFMTPQAVHLIRNRVALLRDEESPERLIGHAFVESGGRVDAWLRLSGGDIVLEGVAASDGSGIDVAGAVERMMGRTEGERTVDSLTRAATRELRGLTGFDSIQIDRCRDGRAECVARFVRSGLEAFEPANVRSALFERPMWIADSESEPVGVQCASQRGRGAAPALLAPPEAALAEEIRRTGARSAILLPIRNASGPWGFALALHRSARAPRLARLSAAELFAHMVGLRLAELEPAGRG